jgi:hypothetical protein
MKYLIMTVMVTVLVFGGCGNDTDTDTDTDTDSDPTIVFSGVVYGYDGYPIQGVQVCVYNVSSLPCSSTTATGVFSLDVPADTLTALELTATNYVSSLYWHRTGTADVSHDLDLLTETEVDAFAAAGGDTYDPTKAALIAHFVDSTSTALAGVTFSLTPSSGHGPVYIDNTTGMPDVSLTQSTSAGIGYWANVDPGTGDVAATYSASQCVPSGDATAGSRTVDLIADTFSVLTFICN